MSPDMWKLVASIGGVLITVVTAPFIWAMHAEARGIRKEIELVRTGIKLELVELEKRLNERLGDKLNDHGERITRLEERRFRG